MIKKSMLILFGALAASGCQSEDRAEREVPDENSTAASSAIPSNDVQLNHVSNSTNKDKPMGIVIYSCRGDQFNEEQLIEYNPSKKFAKLRISENVSHDFKRNSEKGEETYKFGDGSESFTFKPNNESFQLGILSQNGEFVAYSCSERG